MIVATIQQKVILPYKQFDTGSTAPYVYAILLSENEALLYNPSTGKFELKTLSVSGHSHAFLSITNKPTTISGYGITDSYTKTEVDNLLSGVTVDLSNYYTKTEVNNLINNIDLSNYYTKTEIDNKGYLTSLPSHNHDTRYYTETEINNILSGSIEKNGYNNDNWDTAYTWGDHRSLYLKLSGGTLTGSLNGTSGNFQTLSASTSITLNGRVLTIRTL